jgi:hypothetical protein
MNPEQISKIEKSIENLRDKKSMLYFLVQDTKGNAKASISYIYRMAYVLFKNDYNVTILTEKNDYTNVSTWLGSEFAEIPHQSIEQQNLTVAPEDFIIVPELYGFVMPQIKNLPCGKIVLCQSYDYILETLQPGQTWTELGFYKCITTSDFMKEYISNTMRNVSIDVVEPFIPETFQSNGLPSKPIIAVHSREQRETLNLIKNFYIKFPQYRWITFKDMRGLSESDFAKSIQDCCLAVWIDETSSYGTFPLESINSNVPVLGLVPNLVPSWINEDNGLWVNNKIQIVDFVADYLQNWLEDNVNPELYKAMEETTTKLPTEEMFTTNVLNHFSSYMEKRQTSFEEQLNKFQTTEE